MARTQSHFSRLCTTFLFMLSSCCAAFAHIAATAYSLFEDGLSYLTDSAPPDRPTMFTRVSLYLTTGIHRHALPLSQRPDAFASVSFSRERSGNDNGFAASVAC